MKEAARKNLRAQEIKADTDALIAQAGLQGVEDPMEELSRLASASMAMQYAVGQRVNDLSSLTTTDDFSKRQLREEIALYERAMDRTGRFLDQLIRNGFVERQTRVAEAQAVEVVGVIRRVIGAMGLSPEQEQAARVEMAEAFRELDVMGSD